MRSHLAVDRLFAVSDEDIWAPSPPPLCYGLRLRHLLPLLVRETAAYCSPTALHPSPPLELVATPTSDLRAPSADSSLRARALPPSCGLTTTSPCSRARALVRAVVAGARRLSPCALSATFAEKFGPDRVWPSFARICPACADLDLGSPPLPLCSFTTTSLRYRARALVRRHRRLSTLQPPAACRLARLRRRARS